MVFITVTDYRNRLTELFGAGIFNNLSEIRFLPFGSFEGLSIFLVFDWKISVQRGGSKDRTAGDLLTIFVPPSELVWIWAPNFLPNLLRKIN